jgi:menaquinol-cytochrome c reductase cytochrome b/c subunit
MSERKDFKADIGSDARQAPMRVVFITRRTAPAVKTDDEPQVMTYPETFLRIAVAIELLVIALVGISLIWDAPLEQLADPLHTPNPAKAPWYFLGLQELLHYFPPVVAGVLIPGLVIMGLMAIPYCNANIHAEGLWLRDRAQRLRIFGAAAVLCVFLAAFQAYPVLVGTVVIAGFMLWAARCAVAPASGFERWLVSKSLSFWIMTWFLVQWVVLTAIGTFFRGPGWSWVWPWRG